jgi:hypothetical protein
MSATLLIVIVVWFCRSEKMTMSNIVVHCRYGVVLQTPKNVVVYCYWGVVLQEQKKKKKNNVIIPCHFGVVVQVQKNDVEELRCLSLLWCGIACMKK